MKTAGVSNYTNQTPPNHFGWIKCPRPTALNIREKYLINVHKIKGAHFQCLTNHYAKFKYLGMKTVGVTDNTNQKLLKHF